MFSRIATRLQELFTFGADNRAQKRPSDSSNLNPSPSKRPKLIHKGAMENKNFEEELLRRPALSRSGEDVGQVGRPLVGCDASRSRLNSKSATECGRNVSDGRANGYDFSKSARNLTEETSFSFDSKEHTNTSAGGMDSLSRPSLSGCSKVYRRPQNGNPTSPSIFKNWTGFASSKTDQILNPCDPQSNKKRSRTCQDAADRYLHKKVKPKELAIKQCFRIDEMKKYKEMLARYVSPTLLDTVDLTANNHSNTPSEVITISDSESTSDQRRAKGRVDSPARETSPIVIGSAGTSPRSVSDSFGRVPTSMVRSESRTASVGSTDSRRFDNLERGSSWRTMEKKMERASNLLDELSRPSPKNSLLEMSDRIDLTQSRLPKEDVEIAYDRSVAMKKSHLDRSCTPGRRSGAHSKRTSAYVDTIAIDDSDSELSSNADDDDNHLISRKMQNKARQRFESLSTQENYARPGLRSLKDFEVSIKTSPYVKKDYLKNLLDKAEVGVRGLRVRETEAEIKEMRILRQEREAQCNEKVTNLIRLTRRLPVPLEEKYIRVEEEEEEDDDVIIEEPQRDDWPELSDEQEEMVDRAFNCRNPSQVLAEGFRLQITARDIATLQGTNWLNDEVINFYFNMIVGRSQSNKKLPQVYAFNTFFYPKVLSGGQKAVRRWTKNVDIFEHSFVILPVHLGMHWCLAVIDFSRKEVRYYDSMGGKNNACLDALLNYLVDEMQDKKQKVFDCKGWQKINVQGIPQQMNGSDCGMFSCKFADYITKNVKITFNQSHMPYFRRRMVYEILTKKLM